MVAWFACFMLSCLMDCMLEVGSDTSPVCLHHGIDAHSAASCCGFATAIAACGVHGKQPVASGWISADNQSGHPALDQFPNFINGNDVQLFVQTHGARTCGDMDLLVHIMQYGIDHPQMGAPGQDPRFLVALERGLMASQMKKMTGVNGRSRDGDAKIHFGRDEMINAVLNLPQHPPGAIAQRRTAGPTISHILHHPFHFVCV